MGSLVICWAWFRLRPVMQSVILDQRDPDRTPVMQRVIPGWCGRRMRATTRTSQTGAPNKPFQRTPLRVERDRGFFEGQNRLERDSDLSVAAPLNFSVRHPWQRDCLSFFDMMQRIALPEGRLCRLRRASARYAG